MKDPENFDKSLSFILDKIHSDTLLIEKNISNKMQNYIKE